MTTKTRKATKAENSAEESGKKQALDLAIAQITKQFGDGSIMKLELGRESKDRCRAAAVWFPVIRYGARRRIPKR